MNPDYFPFVYFGVGLIVAALFTYFSPDMQPLGALSLLFWPMTLVIVVGFWLHEKGESRKKRIAQAKADAAIEARRLDNLLRDAGIEP